MRHGVIGRLTVRWARIAGQAARRGPAPAVTVLDVLKPSRPSG